MSRPVVVALAVLASAAGSACAGRKAPVVTPEPVPPAPEVADLAGFEDALNVYARLRPQVPARAAYRARLSRFLVDHGRTALERESPEETRSSLVYVARLYLPKELRAAGRDPALAELADRYYAWAARRGRANDALFALAFVQHFGDDAMRRRAVERWQGVERWLLEVSPAAGDPGLRHEGLERALDEVTAELPTPFVVRRAHDLYMARYHGAKAAMQGGVGGTLEHHRAEFTPVLLLRLHLRADDPDQALAALEALPLDVAARKMAEIVRRAFSPEASVDDLLSLAEQFIPDEDDMEVPDTYRRQAWAITENLVRRAIERDPRAPAPHYDLARILTNQGLIDAAVFEIDRALAASPDMKAYIRVAAALRTERVGRAAERGPEEALAALQDLEAFLDGRGAVLGEERRAMRAKGHLAAGEALFRAGRPGEAAVHLEAARRGPTGRAALSLLGAVYRHLGRLDDAKDAYAELRALEPADPMDRALASAEGLSGLAAVEEDEGHGDRARSLRTEAVAVIDAVIDRWMRQVGRTEAPWGRPEQHAKLFLLRGKLSILLGSYEDAERDFKYARRLAPEEPAVYTDALVELLLAGRTVPAAALYREALARGTLAPDLEVYMSLWVYFLTPDDPGGVRNTARQVLAQYAEDDWPKELAQFALGEEPPQTLLARASTRGERAEAEFYVALSKLAAGAGDAAATGFRRVLASDMVGFFEYEMAHRLLDRPLLVDRRAAAAAPSRP